MTLSERVKHTWQALSGIEAQARDERGRFTSEQPTRKTAQLPSIMSPYPRANQMLAPKPTAANLRRFAEMPVARRAINLVKDRIASMDWQIRIRRGYDPSQIESADAKLSALRQSLEDPNTSDSFRTLFEQVLEDILVGGFGAIEMKTTGDPDRPFQLFAVDGAAIQIDPRWDGNLATPRFGFVTGRSGGSLPGADAITPLLDNELIYIRLNPRTWSVFGLGKLEVAFESIGQFLSANRYAGRLASNSVVQYALWLDEATPDQHDRLIRWWQDEIEGTGRVPVLSCEKKPEVLRFAGGTDSDLRLQWQEFLIRMIANAFDLPPMLLGLEQDVNQSTASELADEAFQSAIVPLAKLLAEHITRDIFAKLLGWREFEFHFNDLETRNEQEEVNIQVQLLNAGVLTVNEVRAQRGLPPLPTESSSV
jgi:HK97 family phage portal protein